MPSSSTESPSGSTPSIGMGIRVVMPAKVRPVTGRGAGFLLLSSKPLIEMVTVDEATFFCESDTV